QLRAAVLDERGAELAMLAFGGPLSAARLVAATAGATGVPVGRLLGAGAFVGGRAGRLALAAALGLAELEHEAAVVAALVLEDDVGGVGLGDRDLLEAVTQPVDGGGEPAFAVEGDRGGD